MDFDLSQEQVMLRDAAVRYVQDRYTFHHRRQFLASAEGWSAAAWRDYAEMGWLGLLVPADLGGSGCSFVEAAIVLEAMGAAPVLEPLLASAVLSTRLLATGAPAELREHLLPRMAMGKAIVALADGEVGNRAIGALPSTRAEAVDAGALLSGLKTMVLAGPQADCVLVTCRLSGRSPTGEPGAADRLAIFAVDMPAAGVALEAYRLVDGRAAADVRLENVRCPWTRLVAEGEAAERALEDALDHARLAAVAEALGGMESCLAVTSDHLKTRVQFGRPLGAFQSLQHLMADMFVDTRDARSMLFHGLAHLEDEAPARGRAVAAAKLFVTEAGRRVSSSGVQMHGGYGTVEEYRISHHFRQLLVLEKLFGDARDCLRRLDSPEKAS